MKSTERIGISPLTGQAAGGGVLLGIKNSVKSEAVDLTFFNINFPSIDILACKCIVSHKIFYVLSLYIPPSISFDEFELFFENLEEVDFLQAENVIIVGDFNVPNFMNQANLDRKTSIINSFINFF